MGIFDEIYFSIAERDTSPMNMDGAGLVFKKVLQT